MKRSWSCLIATIILVAFNFQLFFIIENRSNYCYYTIVSDGYILTYNQIDSALYSFAPFAIMDLTNIAIIYKFIKAKLAVKPGTESTNQALSKSAMRGTAILITVSLTFIILTWPNLIYYTLFKDSSDPILLVALHVPKTLNHGIHAILYCVVGSKFRQELFGLICFKKSSGKTVIDKRTTQITITSNITD